MESFKEQTMNLVNGMPLGMNAIGRRSLYKVKTDRKFKWRLVNQSFNQRIGMDFMSSLAAVAFSGTRYCRRVWFVRCTNGSLPKLLNRDKIFSVEQLQHLLLDKREVDVAAVLCANRAA